MKQLVLKESGELFIQTVVEKPVYAPLPALFQQASQQAIVRVNFVDGWHLIFHPLHTTAFKLFETFPIHAMWNLSSDTSVPVALVANFRDHTGTADVVFNWTPSRLIATCRVLFAYTAWNPGANIAIMEQCGICLVRRVDDKPVIKVPPLSNLFSDHRICTGDLGDGRDRSFMGLANRFLASVKENIWIGDLPPDPRRSNPFWRMSPVDSSWTPIGDPLSYCADWAFASGHDIYDAIVETRLV
jgi:hypothetical protein